MVLWWGKRFLELRVLSGPYGVDTCQIQLHMHAPLRGPRGMGYISIRKLVLKARTRKRQLFLTPWMSCCVVVYTNGFATAGRTISLLLGQIGAR